MKEYGQFCPIAAGLDLVGDRWVLLILRELSLGDQRFTDLRSGLPGIAPNLLSERLRGLQDAGLVVSAELPPPAARSIYRLTDSGQQIVPVLRALARFGAPYLDGEPSERFDARRAAYAFLVPWWHEPVEGDAPSWRARLDLAADGCIDLLVDGRRLRLKRPDPAVTPDLHIRTTGVALASARRDGVALDAGVDGNEPVRRAFAAAFELPLSTNQVAQPAGWA
jgi:DNA-binding HxlR family transcriptional regulator